VDKAELLSRLSEEPDEHYRVALFAEEGFERRACERCSRHFWTRDAGRSLCPDDDVEGAYSFIGSPPTARRLDYAAAWRAVESFFVENGHKPVSRYPVVCRWRDDLYFTIASIVDFQRPTGSGIRFELPASQVIVPQPCVRFNDIGNVGVTGRHFSSFCMVGQLSMPDEGGYWKDRCMELDYGLLTRTLGIPRDDVTFVEDVWSGGGSFGPSLEYFVGGLELGNAVFTEFQGSLEDRRPLDRRVIDMGAGLERFAWVTMGTPTAYDCCFGPITSQMAGAEGVEAGTGALCAYYREVARRLASEPDAARARQAAMSALSIGGRAAREIDALEGIYLVADHLRTLAFAIADGALPSNVGGGYNLRVLLRRMMARLGRLGAGHDLDELVGLHVGYLRGTYPELAEAAGEIREIVGLEARRYSGLRSRMGSIASRLKARGAEPDVAELITLYESDGVPPDYLRELGAIREIPGEFYERLSELHQSPRAEEAPAPPGLEGLPRTEALYHGDDPREFDARVLYAGGGTVVLDRTSFYARSGGQEPDHGTIGDARVTDVTSHAGVIAHAVAGGIPRAGETVRCAVDAARRLAVTAHHTSTHILNSSARSVLGSWVWQHSAFKDDTHARLDITHHSALTPEEVSEIESVANSVVRRNLEVSIREHAREEAESRYGFRIYQGGVVPVDAVRIVSVGDFDVEACGGTHVRRTGEIGLLKVVQSERVQDGVVRLVFKAGAAALEHVQDGERTLSLVAGKIGADRQKIPESLERRIASGEAARGRLRALTRRSGPAAAAAAAKAARELGRVRIYTIVDGDLDADYHIAVGEAAVKADPRLVYLALIRDGDRERVVAYSGPEASGLLGAGDLAREASAAMGGSGGGTARFGQGGGADASRAQEAIRRAEAMASATA